jgi:hypothetical protein
MLLSFFYAGIWNVKDVVPYRSEVKKILPPINFKIFLLKYNPKPLPFGLSSTLEASLQNFVKI